MSKLSVSLIALGISIGLLSGTSVEATETPTSAIHKKNTTKKIIGKKNVKKKIIKKAKRHAVHAKKKLSSHKVNKKNMTHASMIHKKEAAHHRSERPPILASAVAFVYDQDSKQVLYSKNSRLIVPIASITKLMTGLIISEAHLSMTEPIKITEADVDILRHSRSRLLVGTELNRGELLHLALMSSENRAAHALARTFPGGMSHFVSLMNEKAAALGMTETKYVEPTGLSSSNRSSARDLAVLVAVAAEHPLLRELTTSKESEVDVGNRILQYRNSNQLVRNRSWDILLQKTGFINEAGKCMVVQARMASRKIIMVLLDSTGAFSRVADAEKVRKWLENQHHLQEITQRKSTSSKDVAMLEQVKYRNI